MSHLQKLSAITDRPKKRVGRGYGSGKGSHTVGRGQKGQKSRGSGKVPVWFEGGQLPLIKRLPMWRGKGRLKSLAKRDEVRLDQLSALAEEVVTLAVLKKNRLVHSKVEEAKIINSGEITRKVTLQGLATTAAARKAIEKAGGKVE